MRLNAPYKGVPRYGEDEMMEVKLDCLSSNPES